MELSKNRLLNMYETMEKYPKVFPFIVTNIIKVGELSRNNGRSC